MKLYHTLNIQCCQNCFTHPHKHHNENNYQNNFLLIEKEVCRLWKNIKVRKNPKKSQSKENQGKVKNYPRVGAFEGVFDGVYLFSKLKTNLFIRPSDLMTIITGIVNREEVQLERVRMKLFAHEVDFFTYLTRCMGSIEKKISLRLINTCFDQLKPHIYKPLPIVVSKKSPNRSSTKKSSIKIKYNNQDEWTLREEKNEQQFHEVYEQMDQVNPLRDSIGTGDSCSLRLNPQSTILMESQLLGVEKGSFIRSSNKRVSVFQQQGNNAKRKSEKYAYLSKEMDIYVPDEGYNVNAITLDELSEDQNIPKRSRRSSRTVLPAPSNFSLTPSKTSNRMNSNVGSLQRPSFMKKSFLKEESRSQHISEQVMGDASQPQYQININLIDEEQSEKDSQEQKNQVQSCRSFRSIESYASSLCKNVLPFQKLPVNSGYFRIDLGSIFLDCEFVHFPAYLNSKNLKYFNEEVIPQKTINSLNMVLQYLNFLCPEFVSRQLLHPIYTSLLGKVDENVHEYNVNLFNIEKGIFQKVLVSSQAALAKQNNKLIYGESSDGNYWKWIVEKAVAKIVGGYEELNNHTEIQKLLKILTGAPIILIHTIDLQKIKKLIGKNHFRGENQKNKKILCFPPTSNGWFPEMINFEINQKEFLKSRVTIQYDQQIQYINYDTFSVIFDYAIIWFWEDKYIHDQVVMEYVPVKAKISYDEHGRCQNKTNMNPAWKVLFRMKKNSCCYFEFTEHKNLQKRTIIMLFKLVDIAKKKIGNSQTEKAIIQTQSHNNPSKFSKKQLPNSPPLRHELKELEFIGKITKSGSFFFEVQLEPGFYVCQIMREYERYEENALHFYGEKGTQILDSIVTAEKIQGVTLKDPPKMYFKYL